MKKLTTFLVLLCVMGSLFAITLDPNTGATGATGSSKLTVTLDTTKSVDTEYAFWIAKTYTAGGEKADQAEGIQSGKDALLEESDDGTKFEYGTTLWWECRNGSGAEDFKVEFEQGNAKFIGPDGSTPSTIDASLTISTGKIQEDLFNAANITGGTDVTVTSNSYQSQISAGTMAYSGKLPFAISATAAQVYAAESGIYTSDVTIKITLI